MTRTIWILGLIFLTQCSAVHQHQRTQCAIPAPTRATTITVPDTEALSWRDRYQWLTKRSFRD